MDALRTAVVLVLLLALGYGVWVVLNHDSGVEEPPSFDWSAETADSGPSGFGDGPFVPPAGDTAAADTGFQYGADVTTNADTESNSTGPGASAFTGGGASAYQEPARGLTTDPNMPPPPPGFAKGGTDAGDSLATADPPAPTETIGANRYGDGSGTAAADPVPEGSAYGDYSTPDTGSAGVGETAQDSSAPPSNSSPLTPAAASPVPVGNYSDALATAKSQIEQNEHYEALYTLSEQYGNPALAAAQRKELAALLDRLAGRVIYSTEHLLEPAYVVRNGEDLISISKELKVPHQLLQNINAVKDPKLVTPGTSLKVVRGPFRAEVNLAGSELTLFLGPLYAGRFPISVGAEPSPAPGEYQVRGKEQGKAYFGSNGASFPADHPSNPYGSYWIDLGNQICIHGTPSIGDNPGMGCVSLSPVDAGDVFGILSAGSKVVIRR